MPNRGAGGVSYRYGFNGKETENDVKGIGNEQDYGMRIYDPRLGRFLSVDPLMKVFPMLTPYQFASNTPLQAIDLDGEEAKIVTIRQFELYNDKGKLIFTNSTHIEQGVGDIQLLINRLIGKTGTLIVYERVTDRLEKDGKVSTTKQILNEFYLAGPDDKMKFGLYFVSKKGGFYGTSGTAEGDPIDLDLLVKVVGGFPKGNLDTEMSPFAYTGNEINKMAKLLEVLKSDKSFAAKFEKVLAALKFNLSLGKRGVDVYKNIPNFSGNGSIPETDIAPKIEPGRKNEERNGPYKDTQYLDRPGYGTQGIWYKNPDTTVIFMTKKKSDSKKMQEKQ